MCLQKESLARTCGDCDILHVLLTSQQKMLFAGSNGGMFVNVPGMFGNGFGGKQEVADQFQCLHFHAYFLQQTQLQHTAAHFKKQ